MDSLKRLRLIYEDCLGNCDFCGREGAVGDTLKLFEYADEAGLPSPRIGADYYLRCADRTSCGAVAAGRVAASLSPGDPP